MNWRERDFWQAASIIILLLVSAAIALALGYCTFMEPAY